MSQHKHQEERQEQEHQQYNPLYAVVYGREWDDIMYFGDFYKAKAKLLIQQQARKTHFFPFLSIYRRDDEGVYRRDKHTYTIASDPDTSNHTLVCS